MGKRFTETAKWDDLWFRSLPPLEKLAWQYLCDRCDQAGVIELDQHLADFQIGQQVNWQQFIDSNKARIERLPDGKLWLTKFIQFQYPQGLSRECRAHNPIFASLEKHTLLHRVSKDYPDSIHTVHEKEKETDKEKEKDSGKGDARGKPKRTQIEAASVPVPDGFETPSVRSAIQDWLDYKAKRGEPYKDSGHLGRKVAEFARAGPEAFVAAVNSCIGSNYAGLFPQNGGVGGKSRVGSGQRYLDGT